MRKFGLGVWIGVLVAAFPMISFAGAVVDADLDTIPDQFDNCRTVQNGPNQIWNQNDSDADGYGDRCDADYDQDGATAPSDFSRFLQCFGTTWLTIYPPLPNQPAPFCAVTDYDRDSATTPLDLTFFLSRFGRGGVLPSGLACADPTIRVDLGNPPCAP